MRGLEKSLLQNVQRDLIGNRKILLLLFIVISIGNLRGHATAVTSQLQFSSSDEQLEHLQIGKETGARVCVRGRSWETMWGCVPGIHRELLVNGKQTEAHTENRPGNSVSWVQVPVGAGDTVHVFAP